MKQINVVAFDCDGVMFDTRKANTAYYDTLLEHFGKPLLTPEKFEFCHMHTVDESLEFLFPEPDLYQKAQIFRKQIGYLPFIDKMEIEPDLKRLLTGLRSRFKTAIATNRTDTMDRVLDQFDLKRLFDLVVTAQDVKHPKPHPESLLKIIDYFKVKPEQVLYVGDSELDRQAAEGAGVPFIAFNNPKLSTRRHVNTMKDLEKLLENSSTANI